MQTLYDQLGVPQDADEGQIRTALEDARRAVAEDPELARNIDLEHIEQVLLDPDERAQYDVMLAEVGANANSLGLMAGSAWETVSPKGPVYLDQTIGGADAPREAYFEDDEEEEMASVLRQQSLRFSSAISNPERH